MSNYRSPLLDFLQTPIMKAKKRIFISFVYNDDKNYFNLLHAWSENEGFDLEFYSESVRDAFDSENADYIKRQIREKIKRASVTLCLCSEDTHTSRWVNWEIKESIESGNNLIAVKTSGKVKYIPSAFKGQEYIWVNEFKYAKIKDAIDRS